MSWWGKTLGGGLGGLLSMALGHTADKQGQHSEGEIGSNHERIQTAFFTATFSIMGYLAKADGRVSETEIRHAQLEMRKMFLSEEQKQTAQALFAQGKADDFPFDEVLEQFRKECHRRQTLVTMFVEIQVMTAMADGHLDLQEQRILIHITEQLGLPRQSRARTPPEHQSKRRAAGLRGGLRSVGCTI
jgi:DnaJ like chaperone protein